MTLQGTQRMHGRCKKTQSCVWRFTDRLLPNSQPLIPEGLLDVLQVWEAYSAGPPTNLLTTYVARWAYVSSSNPKILSSSWFSSTAFQVALAAHGVIPMTSPHSGPENGCLTKAVFLTSVSIRSAMMRIGQNGGPTLGKLITLGSYCWIVSRLASTSGK